MPARPVKRKGRVVGYRWGSKGKLYPVSRHGKTGALNLAKRQGRAIHASKARVMNMARKKKSYKSGTNTNTFLIIALIIVFVYGGQQGWFRGLSYTFTGDQVDLFNSPGTLGTESCRISLNDDEYCVGDLVSATLSAQPNKEFHIGINKDDTGWVLFETATTDSSGKITRTGNVNDAGTYKIRAISDYCVTNLVEVDVIVCADQQPDDENCWWQSIAKESISVPSGIFSNWHGILVEGKFKFEWSYSNNGVDTEISKDATVKHTSSDQSGSYTFNSNNGEVWQISAINDLPVASTINFELFQWVCEGDDLNWNPGMTGSQGEYSGQAGWTCDDYCRDIWGSEMYGVCGVPPVSMEYDRPCVDPIDSYYLASSPADDWCEQNDPVYNHCCCWSTPPN